MKSLVPRSSFDTDNKELLKSQEFQNYVDNDYWALNVLMSQQKNIVKINREILTLISQEIE